MKRWFQATFSDGKVVKRSVGTRDYVAAWRVKFTAQGQPDERIGFCTSATRAFEAALQCADSDSKADREVVPVSLRDGSLIRSGTAFAAERAARAKRGAR